MVAWGDPSVGGDIKPVIDRLWKVKSVYSTSDAFAAVKEDGSVVTWGSPLSGGNSDNVQAQLKKVQFIAVSGGAFAAIVEGGSVV